jgi:hypothetical protein
VFVSDSNSHGFGIFGAGIGIVDEKSMSMSSSNVGSLISSRSVKRCILEGVLCGSVVCLSFPFVLLFEEKTALARHRRSVHSGSETAINN